jgi:hypothetical protein
MAVVMSYTDTVRQILARVAEHLKRIPKPGVETLLVEDPAQAVFLLRRLGWDAGRRVNNTVISARMRDGRVWVEEDNTDLSFTDELLRAGVPKDDIVLAFQPPELRHLTDFAVA